MNNKSVNFLAVLTILCLAGCDPPTGAMPGPEATRTSVPPLEGAPEPYVRVIEGGAAPQAGAQASAVSEHSKPDPLAEIRLDVVQFSDMPLGQAAMMLTKMIGANVVASAAASDRKVSVYLKDVSARAAIEGVCRLNGLWYREDQEMIRLLTNEEYGRELVIKSDEQTRLYYLRNASAPAVADMIAALMPDQVEYIRPTEEASFSHVGTDGDDPMSNAARAATGGAGASYASSYGAAYGTPYGATGEAVGGLRGRSRVARSSYAYTPADVAAGYQRGLEAGRIEQLAKGAAERQKGEVTAQAAAERTGAKLPVTISVFLRNNCIGVRTVQESVHREIGKIIEALDTPTRQVLLEVKVLKISLGKGFESLFSMAYANTGHGSKVGIKLFEGANTEGGATVTFGYLDKYISATLKLLKEDNRLHAVATPMLLCANNAPAAFFSGVTRMIVTNYDFETRYGENNQAVDIARPVVEEREIGTQVRIKPSINADGTVTLRFYLEIGSVREKGGSVFQIKGNELVELPIDVVDNEKVESIVVARHGQAIVMGGLISESISKGRSRVPVLGEVPVVGTFFGKRRDSTSRTETVVIIIPHIIGTPSQGEVMSNAALKNNSAHPWVLDKQGNLTRWDPGKGRVEDAWPPPIKGTGWPQPEGEAQPGGAGTPAGDGDKAGASGTGPQGAGPRGTGPQGAVPQRAEPRGAMPQGTEPQEAVPGGADAEVAGPGTSSGAGVSKPPAAVGDGKGNGQRGADGGHGDAARPAGAEAPGRPVSPARGGTGQEGGVKRGDE